MIYFNGKEIKGAIFDLDGTLFDSCGIWKDVDNRFFKKRGMDVPPHYGDEIGHLGLDKAAQYTKEKYKIKETEAEIIQEWMDDVSYFYQNEVSLKPHAKELLIFLKNNNIKLAVATANSPECYIPALKRNGVYDYFDYIEDVRKIDGGKKTPRIYLNVSEHFGLSPENIIVFEDIILGISNAIVSSFITCAVYEKTCKDEEQKKEKADFYIEDFNEMIEKLK